jgi:rhomboid protease GluP
MTAQQHDATSEFEPEIDLQKAEMRNQYIQALAGLPAKPIVTIAIMIANIGVFALMVGSGVDFMQPDGATLLGWGANFGPRTMNGEWWRLLSCMFLHFGVVHIGMNMLVLWGLGRPTERFVGSVGFAIAYLLSGLAGGLASLAWHPDGISAGASGAVFGAAGTLLGFALPRRDTIPSEVRSAMLKSMANFLILNTVVGLSASRIDMAAHTGGFLGGMLCGLVLSQPMVPGMRNGRMFRNGLTLLMGIVLVPAGMMALPEAPTDIEAEIQKLTQLEESVYRKFDSAQTLAESGDIDAAEFANRIEQQVLPEWKDYRDKLKAVSTHKFANKDYFEPYVEYAQFREQSWQLHIEGLREKDPIRKRKFMEQAQAAEVMIEKIMAPSKP